MAVKDSRWLVYADEDDAAIKIHGPMSPAQAEGFVAGAEWVNDSSVEHLGAYGSLKAARDSCTEDGAMQEQYDGYEVEEMGFEAPNVGVGAGECHLLYFDGDYDLLKIRGPLSFAQAQGFGAGVDWANDSALEFEGGFASSEAANAAAQQYIRSKGEFEIEEFAVDIASLDEPVVEI